MANLAEIHIVLTDKKEVLVTGSIDDQLASYALLACAHDAIKDHHDSLAQKIIRAPRIGIPGRG